MARLMSRWSSFWSLFWLVVLWAAFGSRVAYPSEQAPASCPAVKDPDQRCLCYALQLQDTTWCSMIVGHDLHELCFAVVGHQPSRCELVKDANVKAMCRATAKKG